MEDMTRIEAEAYEYDTDIKEFVVPKTVKTIGRYAFCGSSLEKITLPDGIEEIEPYAVSGTKITEIILPASLKQLGKSAFKYCRYLKKIEFPKDMEYIPQEICYDCGRLSEIVLPESVKQIGERAFSGCAAIEELKLPEGIKTIKTGAFSQCISLKKINIPESMETIEKSTFSYCSQLVKMYFPKGVRSIGKGQFFMDQMLEEIVISGELTDKVPLQKKEMWDSCFAMKRIIAPNMVPEDFHALWRKWLVNGFASHYTEGNIAGQEIVEKHVDELKNNWREYSECLLEYRSLLQFAIEFEVISREDTEKLIQEALEGHDTEIKTMLLEYKNKLTGGESAVNSKISSLLDDLF